MVDQERARRREERNEERTRRKEEAELESKLRMAEMEKEKELRMAEMEKEKELLMLRRDLPNNPATDANSTGETRSETGESQAARPERISPHKLMPVFNEGRDDLDAYLMRFERVAESQNWPRDQWATALSLCLSGEALSVFSRMSASECLDYNKLRQALMIRFRMTEEGFREKFRSASPRNEETCSQFVTRLQNFLDRWIELSDTKKEYADLFDLILKEQFLSNCATPLQMFLKEKKDTSFSETVARAEKYVEAHGWSNFGKRSTPKNKAENAVSKTTERRETLLQSSDAKSSDEKKCFICSRTGHRPENCRAAPSDGSGPPKKCHKCGKPGHPSWRCWANGARNREKKIGSPLQYVLRTDTSNLRMEGRSPSSTLGSPVKNAPSGNAYLS